MAVYKFNQKIILDTVETVLKTTNSTHFIIAYSGGIDSTVLLHSLFLLQQKKHIKTLSAIHINHGLSPHANQWSEHCQSICYQYNIPLQIHKVFIPPTQKGGIEQAARSARYQIFERIVKYNTCLLLGHHQNDQAETLLFRLFRGTGLQGLTSIPIQRPLAKGMLLRPLLNISKREIENYANNLKLQFIEDESNSDLQLTRNYIRHSLIPIIEKTWPGASARLATLTQDMSHHNQWLQIEVEKHLTSVLQPPPNYWQADQVITIEKLKKKSTFLAYNIIRKWLSRKNLIMPDRKIIHQLFTEVIYCKTNSNPVFKLQNHEIRRCNGLLIIMPALQAFQAQEYTWEFDKESELFIQGSGRLIASTPFSGKLTIKFRQQLSHIPNFKIEGHQHSKSVKRWLQHYRIPEWMRNRIPFIFRYNQLLGVAGIWNCQHNQNNFNTMTDINWLFEPT